MSAPPANSPKVSAYINLFAVLKSLEELVRLDEQARTLIKNTHLTLRFTVRGGPVGAIHFDDGAIRVVPGIPERCDIHLYFLSANHFNRMIDGTGTPIPLKGLTKLKFLTGKFSQLANRLESYLKPTPSQLQDKAYFNAHCRLLGMVAFFSLSQIGNFDAVGRSSAKLMPDGDIQVRAGDDYCLTIQAKGGSLQSLQKGSDNHRCELWFKDLKALHEVLSDERHIYDLIGQGRAGMNGFVVMVDCLSPILGRIPAYLS